MLPVRRMRPAPRDGFIRGGKRKRALQRTDAEASGAAFMECVLPVPFIAE